jgi:hypothetical protein
MISVKRFYGVSFVNKITNMEGQRKFKELKDAKKYGSNLKKIGQKQIKIKLIKSPSVVRVFN